MTTISPRRMSAIASVLFLVSVSTTAFAGSEPASEDALKSTTPPPSELAVKLENVQITSYQLGTLDASKGGEEIYFTITLTEGR